MSDLKPQEKKPELTMHVCGPRCADGTTNHQWDGPPVKLENGGTASCSKCGALAIDVSLWELP